MVRRFDFLGHDLLEILYSGSSSKVTLSLLESGGDKPFSFELRGIIFFRYSESPDEPGTPCFIDAEVFEFSRDEAIKKVRQLGYGLEGPEFPLIVYHFHGDSSVVIDIFANEVEKL